MIKLFIGFFAINVPLIISYLITDSFHAGVIAIFAPFVICVFVSFFWMLGDIVLDIINTVKSK